MYSLGPAAVVAVAAGLPLLALVATASLDGSTSYVAPFPNLYTRAPTFGVRVVVADRVPVDVVELWYSRWSSKPTMYARLDEGPWTWTFDSIAMGGDGNYSFYSVTYAGGTREAAPMVPDAFINVDTTKPTSAVVPLRPFINQTVFQVRVQAQDNMGIDHVDLFVKSPHSGGSRFLQMLKPPPWVYTVDTRAISGGGDGPYQFYSKAVDRAGNVEEMPQADAVATVVDTRPPSSHLLGDFPPYYTHTLLLLSAAATDGGSGVARVDLWYQRDGAAWANLGPGTPTDQGQYAWTVDTARLAGDGHYAFMTGAYDAAGNAQPPTDAREVVVDATGPNLSVNAPADGSYAGSSSVGVAWTAKDAVSGVDHYEVSLDGSPFVNIGLSVRQTYRELPDGGHTVVIRAYDGAGNMAEETVHFSVDTNPFSPSGPYGLALTGLVAGVGLLLAVVAFLKLRRRRPHRARGGP